MKDYHILAVNPGSTSTKVAIYKNKEELLELTLRHEQEQMNRFVSIQDQFKFRKEIILQTVKDAGIDIRDIDVVIGRGGILKPIPSGVYEVNELMKSDLISGIYGDHASNLGGLIASDIATSIGVKAYIADPVVVDELHDVARITGVKEIRRRSVFHALNQKAISRQYAQEIDRRYEDMNFVVAHMGGGVSVGAHLKGQIIDVTNALDGEGGFSPERCGALPVRDVVDMCFSGDYSRTEIDKLICGNGGFLSLKGINDSRELIRMYEENGDKEALLTLYAFAYNIGKNIGAMASVLKGDVDAVILTGGVANNPIVVAYITEMVRHISPVILKPKENELEALCLNVLSILDESVLPKVYI